MHISSHPECERRLCFTCRATFPSAFLVKAHIAAGCDGAGFSGPTTCFSCKKRFKSRSDLDNHLAKSTACLRKSTTPICSRCKAPFPHKGALKKHLASASSCKPPDDVPSRKSACKSCGTSFSERSELYAHLLAFPHCRRTPRTMRSASVSDIAPPAVRGVHIAMVYDDLGLGFVGHAFTQSLHFLTSLLLDSAFQAASFNVVSLSAMAAGGCGAGASRRVTLDDAVAECISLYAPPSRLEIIVISCHRTLLGPCVLPDDAHVTLVAVEAGVDEFYELQRACSEIGCATVCAAKHNMNALSSVFTTAKQALLARCVV